MPVLTKNVLGVFVVEQDEVVDHELFSGSLEEVAAEMGEETTAEKRFRGEYGGLERGQMDAFDLGKQVGAVSDREELYQLQHEVAVEFTRRELQEGQSKDELLVQAVRALSDTDKINNKYVERLRAWYSLYFPEMEDEIDDHERFVELVAERFERGKIEEVDEDSTGMDVDAGDREVLQRFASQAREGMAVRDELETYIKNLAEKLVPNVSAVLGRLLAARMVSQAGSLDKLAKMPSSTVQVLGAEKALFRHMRGEGSAPKHGIMFMHPKVRGLPDSKRGKMARFLANKTSIAARLDRYGGDFKGEQFKQDVEEKYQEIREE